MFGWLFGKNKNTKKNTKKSTKKRTKKSTKKPSKNIIKMCKKYKVRLTIKKNNKRIYKPEALLRTQCNNKKNKKNKFGLISATVPSQSYINRERCKNGFTPGNLVPIPTKASDFESAQSKLNKENQNQVTIAELNSLGGIR